MAVAAESRAERAQQRMARVMQGTSYRAGSFAPDDPGQRRELQPPDQEGLFSVDRRVEPR